MDHAYPLPWYMQAYLLLFVASTGDRDGHEDRTTPTIQITCYILRSFSRIKQCIQHPSYFTFVLYFYFFMYMCQCDSKTLAFDINHREHYRCCRCRLRCCRSITNTARDTSHSSNYKAEVYDEKDIVPAYEHGMATTWNKLEKVARKRRSNRNINKIHIISRRQWKATFTCNKVRARCDGTVTPVFLRLIVV